MAAKIFDLTGIAERIVRHRKLLLGVSLAAAACGAVFYFAGTKYYQAKTEFVLRNGMYNDRNVIFNSARDLDYFASEDDVNRVITWASSSAVLERVIRHSGIAASSKIDTSKPEGRERLQRLVEKRVNVLRTEYRDIALTYMDADAAKAAEVANCFVAELDKEYRDYYQEMRMSMANTVNGKIRYEDSVISRLTDSLVMLRKQYGVYDIMSPARHNIMLGNASHGSGDVYAKGVEEIQNVEAIKDEMVADRAVSITLANQYKLALQQEQLPLVKVITPATAPIRPQGLGALLTILVCAVVAFFFTLVIVLLTENIFHPVKELSRNQV